MYQSRAPEFFQCYMSKVLKGLEGVVCLVNDVLVYGKDQKQHDERLRAVRERLQREGLTLNREKCTFSQSHEVLGSYYRPIWNQS